MKTASLLLALSYSTIALANAETKLSCPEVAATELKCKDFETQNAACDALVDTEIKAKIEASKTQVDECKKKNSMTYVIKCKKEISNSTKLINTPKQLASGPIQKELIAKADSACAKAETIGKASPICKAPKKVLDTMKANCIKTQ